jgi:hypothetical protein
MNRLSRNSKMGQVAEDEGHRKKFEAVAEVETVLGSS